MHATEPEDAADRAGTPTRGAGASRRPTLSLSTLMVGIAVAGIWAAVFRIAYDHRAAFPIIWRHETRYRTPEPMRWDVVVPANRNLNPREQDR